jgi:hypothetical protein
MKLNLFGKTGTADDQQSKSEADLLVEKLGASIDERLKPLTEKVEGIASWQSKIEEQFKAETAPDPNKNSDGTELTAEQKAERDKNALFALTVQANARITETEVLNAIQNKWPQFVAEARGIFAKTNWQRKTQADYPDYCNNVVDMLIGREAKKGGLGYDSNTSRFFVEDSAASTGGEDSPLNNAELTWTDERTGRTLTASEQLARLKIDPKKFTEWMKQTGQAV